MKIEIGYYQVGDKIYPNKFDAVLAAQHTGETVDWHFFDNVLNQVNWSVEPALSLDQLYRIRAQQIRDAYDYVIVFCSGGADSNNVIRTFLHNNIHVDEVIGIAPMSGLSNWNFDRTNISEENTASETKFALFPLLNEIASKNPKIKITINDFFEDVLKYKDESWTYEGCGNIVTVLTSHFTEVSKFKHIDALIQQGKRIGLVYGTDKPIIRISESGNMFSVIADSGINYLNMPTSREYPNVDRVLFYWSAELPELMVKQAHVVAKAIHLPENIYIQNYLKGSSIASANTTFQDVIDSQIKDGKKDPISKNKILASYLPIPGEIHKLTSFTSKSVYQRTIVPFIYPTTWSKDLFQCQKVNADAGFFTEDQLWVHSLHGNTRLSEMVISGVKSLYNSIQPKYLNSNGTGFINNFKVYKFAHTSQFV